MPPENDIAVSTAGTEVVHEKESVLLPEVGLTSPYNWITPLTLGLASSLITVSSWLVPAVSQCPDTADGRALTPLNRMTASRLLAPAPTVSRVLVKVVAPAVVVVPVAVASMARTIYGIAAIRAVTAGMKFVACAAVKVSHVSPVVRE